MDDLRVKFNEDEVNYDKWRPSYVPELFHDLIQYSHLDSAKKALEIGIGTGQATLPILKTGCRLTAIDIGDKLAEYTRKKFDGFKKLNVINIDFESLNESSCTYDLIYSATAFHWIPEEIGYRKAFELLKPGGVFALFWNHPFVNREDDMLHREIQKIYGKYRPMDRPPAEFDENDCRKYIDALIKYKFTNISSKLYHQTRTFLSKDYVSLLNTYSDHRSLQADMKNSFEKEIVSAIDKFGGKIHIYDTIDLYLAVRP